MLVKQGQITPPWIGTDRRRRNILPGFGTAVVTFSIYVIYDELFAKKKAQGRGHGEGLAAH